MKYFEVLILLFLSTLLIVGCADDLVIDEDFMSTVDVENAILADDNAVEEVKELRTRIVEISKVGVAFGHQDATAYGMNWEHSGFPSDSDVLRVTGDYPAVIGFDLGRIEIGRRSNINGIRFSLMQELIKEAHTAGSIITLTWHARNPITGGTSWNTSGDINRILPTGDRHEILNRDLSLVAEFINSLIDSEGRPIPILFRPWHEMNGDWFWWGRELLTEEEFQQLYRTTVDILTNTYEVHNVLYTYSPNCALNEEEYLKYYPGDAWVDLLGVDVYDFADKSYFDVAKTSLETIAILGNKKNKPYAFTETGLENITEHDWWTNKLYPIIQHSGAAYTLIWRNDRSVHWFVPFENHGSVDNFIEFVDKPDILLRSDIK